MKNDKIIGVPYELDFVPFRWERLHECRFHSVKSDIGCQRGNDATLRCTASGFIKHPIVNDSRFEPAFHGMPHCWIAFEFGEQCLVVNVIETAFQVSIQDILGLVINDDVDGFDSIMTGASWAKAVAIGFKFALPFRFERKLYKSLLSSISHDGNA